MRRSRRAFLRRAGAAAAGIALCSCASTQGTKKVRRLGYFAAMDTPDPALVPIIRAFLDGPKAAAGLVLTIPLSVLGRATKVIQ